MTCSFSRVRNTYKFSIDGKLTKGPPLPEGLMGILCGLRYKRANESYQAVVVGVVQKDSSNRGKTDILEEEADQWTPGPVLHVRLNEGVMVQVRNTLIVTGGRYLHSSNEHTLFWALLEEEVTGNLFWRKLNTQASPRKSLAVSFAIPNDYAAC